MARPRPRLLTAEGRAAVALAFLAIIAAYAAFSRG